MDVHIGSVHVYLQSLTYMVRPLVFLEGNVLTVDLWPQIELEEQLTITDYKGNEQGLLSVEVWPCNKDGTPLSDDEDMFVEEPEELVRQQRMN